MKRNTVAVTEQLTRMTYPYHLHVREYAVSRRVWLLCEDRVNRSDHIKPDMMALPSLRGILSTFQRSSEPARRLRSSENSSHGFVAKE